jgi:hypothetical protein
MAVAYNKFNCFVADEANKIHNLGSDQLTVALTDVAPVATNTVQGNIVEISYTNLSTRNITVTSSIQVSGTYSLIANQLTLTASGTVPQFRYVVLYNSTAAGKNLIAWYDNGSEVNLINTDLFVVGFDLSNGILQVA